MDLSQDRISSVGRLEDGLDLAKRRLWFLFTKLCTANKTTTWKVLLSIKVATNVWPSPTSHKTTKSFLLTRGLYFFSSLTIFFPAVS